MNRKIGSYGRYYCLCSLGSSLYLLLPLVFTATVLEISLFRHLKGNIQALRKFKSAKTFQELTLFWNFLVLWQNVSIKFPDPMLSGNLEYFNKKKKTGIHFAINIQSHRNQTFDLKWHNNEYLAVKYIRYFTNDIIWCL